MAGAGSSQRQKARRSTMSTALSRFDPSASAMLADFVIPFSVSKSRTMPAPGARFGGRKALHLRASVPAASTCQCCDGLGVD